MACPPLVKNPMGAHDYQLQTKCTFKCRECAKIMPAAMIAVRLPKETLVKNYSV